jgi:DNA-binding NarL/FixJ family response regulator
MAIARESTAQPIRIVLVDDHPAFRRGIREIISDEPDMRVVGEAFDAREALGIVRELGPDQIDVILMDINLPLVDGITATRSLLAEFPDLSIIMLTVSGLDQDLYDSVLAGAVGFLSKSLTPDAIIRTIRSFHHGGPLPIPRTAATKLPERLRRQGAEEAPAETQWPAGTVLLTSREQQVMRFLELGSHDWEIAAQLEISETTAKKHVRSILQKLGARNRTDAVARYRGRR